jgi:PAS domain-containing protein
VTSCKRYGNDAVIAMPHTLRVTPDDRRRHLQLVSPASHEETFSWSWFCGHCAAPPVRAVPAPHQQRVCESCGVGLMQQAPADAAPVPNEAFVIVDSSLSVQSMSPAAEQLLAVSGDDAVERRVTDLLVPADAEAQGPAGLAAAITQSAGGATTTTGVFVRPGATFGVRLRAQVGPCGPPRAALIVFR